MAEDEMMGDEEAPLLGEMQEERRQPRTLMGVPAVLGMLAVIGVCCFWMLTSAGSQPQTVDDAQRRATLESEIIARLEKDIAARIDSALEAKLAVQPRKLKGTDRFEGSNKYHAVYSYNTFPELPPGEANKEMHKQTEKWAVPFADLMTLKWAYALYVILFFTFALILSSIVNTICDACDKKPPGEREGYWIRFAKYDPRYWAAYLRASDSLRQNLPTTVHEQEKNENGSAKPNLYRIVALVGPRLCLKQDEDFEDIEDDLGPVIGTGRQHDLRDGDGKLPTVWGYFEMVSIAICAGVMQICIPWVLFMDQWDEFHLIGVKRFRYYTDNGFCNTLVRTLPLMVLTAKFFVTIQSHLRQEINRCSFTIRAMIQSEVNNRSTHRLQYHRQVKCVLFWKLWTLVWTLASVCISVWSSVIMILYVTHSVAAFPGEIGSLMQFVLKVFGSYILMTFDEDFAEKLPMWKQWYRYAIVDLRIPADHLVRAHNTGRIPTKKSSKALLPARKTHGQKKSTPKQLLDRSDSPAATVGGAAGVASTKAAAPDAGEVHEAPLIDMRAMLAQSMEFESMWILIVHTIVYITFRVMTLYSMMFIVLVYYVDNNGQHIGI